MGKIFTELVFIIDKSGSMSGLETDTIGGFNSLIEKQKKEEGEAVVSVVLFNNHSSVILNRAALCDVPVMTAKEYYVGGNTALLDAIGNAITHISSTQLQLPKENIPDKTVFIITTDGQENSSKEYSYKQIKSMIDNKKSDNQWEFVFLGANIDVNQEADKLGIDRNKAVRYQNCADGVSMNYEAMDCMISEVREGKSISGAWRTKIDKKNRMKF